MPKAALKSDYDNGAPDVVDVITKINFHRFSFTFAMAVDVALDRRGRGLDNRRTDDACNILVETDGIY